MGSFFSFLRDVIADVKTSWRFRVAVLIWIPLIVVSGVLVVRFGIRHTLSAKYREFKTTFIPETTVNYPDIEIYFRNTQFTGACSQDLGQGQPPAKFLFSGCQDTLPDTTSVCKFFPLSQKQTSQTADMRGQPIHCNFTFQPMPGAPNANQEMYLLLPGGWNTSSTWNYANPVPLRPNLHIGIQLFHEVFFGYGQKVDNWFAMHQYMDSEFPDGTSAYNISMRFSIPFTALEVNWEEDGFDSWFLMATWGGGIFFFYFLFLISFNIAKFFLPDDSRLLRSGGAELPSQPLMSS